MNYDTNELLYMSHFVSEEAERALFIQFEGLITYIVSNIIETYNPMLINYKDDLKQEAWISFYEAINAYRSDRDAVFTTFMAVVVRRKVLNMINRYYGNEPFKYGNVYEIDNVINDYSWIYDKDYNNPMFNPEYYLHYGIANEDFKKIFDGLSKKEKELFDVWVSGKRYKEAAKALNIPLKTYDGRKQSLKKKIRKELLGE